MAITPTNTFTKVATVTIVSPSRFDGLGELEVDYVQANTAVPEPTSLSLIGLGLGLSLGLRKRGPVHVSHPVRSLPQIATPEARLADEAGRQGRERQPAPRRSPRSLPVRAPRILA